MSIKAMEDKLVVSAINSEEVSSSGIILSAKQKVGADEHVVVSSGVSYLNSGDVVICETPSKTWKPDGMDVKVGVTNAPNALLRRHGDTWKPLRNDILVQPRKEKDVANEIILVKDDPDQNVLQVFDVIDVGDECKDIAIGDIVVLPWLRVTPPFTIKGYETYGVTNESEVVAIVEE